MKIIYLPLALDDINKIFDYIAKDMDNFNVAINIVDKIGENINLLKTLPQLGLKAKNERLQRLGYRQLILDPYIVFYIIIDDDTIEIIRIIHGKRQYSSLL